MASKEDSLSSDALDVVVPTPVRAGRGARARRLLRPHLRGHLPARPRWSGPSSSSTTPSAGWCCLSAATASTASSCSTATGPWRRRRSPSVLSPRIASSRPPTSTHDVPARYSNLPGIVKLTCTPVAAAGRWLGVIFADRDGAAVRNYLASSARPCSALGPDRSAGEPCPRGHPPARAGSPPLRADRTGPRGPRAGHPAAVRRLAGARLRSPAGRRGPRALRRRDRGRPRRPARGPDRLVRRQLADGARRGRPARRARPARTPVQAPAAGGRLARGSRASRRASSRSPSRS